MVNGKTRIIAAALLLAASLAAAVLHVPTQYATIQTALDAAGKNDTIMVAPGEYVLAAPLNFNRLHDPSNPQSPAARDLALKSEGGAATTVLRLSATQGAQRSVIMFLYGETSRSLLEGFTLTGGKGTDDGTGVLQGGGVFCDKSGPTLRACAISGNSATEGGGVYASSESAPTLINCVLAGNTAGKGGGVYAWSSARLSMENCTLAGNTGDGFFYTMYCVEGPNPDQFTCYGPFSILTNCILWDNRGRSIGMEGGLGPRAVNSCISGDDVWIGRGNINADPLFVNAGLWDDGGTPADFSDDSWTGGDLRLQEGSPCIDTGWSEGMATTDVEGYARPCGDGVDMGAYERGQCAIAALRFLRGDANSDGTMDIGDAVYTLSFLFAHGPAAKCSDTADANDDGAIDIADAIAILSHLFGGGAPLPSPFKACGLDTTIDLLGCVLYANCR